MVIDCQRLVFLFFFGLIFILCICFYGARNQPHIHTRQIFYSVLPNPLFSFHLFIKNLGIFLIIWTYFDGGQGLQDFDVLM